MNSIQKAYQNPALKKDILEVLIANIELLVNTLFSLVFLSLLSTHYSKEEFGEISYFIVVYTFFNSLVIFGSDNLLLEKENSYLDFAKNYNVFWFRLINVLILGSAFVIMFDFKYYYLIYLLAPFTILFEKSKINRKNKDVFLSRLVFITVVFVLKVIFLIYNSIELVKFSILLEVTFGAFLISRRLLLINIKPNLYRYIAVFRQSFPYALASMSVMLYSRIDQLLIPSLSGYEDLASYSVAIRVGDSLNFVISVTTLVLARKYLSRNEGIMRMYYYASLGGVLLLLILAFIGPLIIRYLFEDFYNKSVLTLFWIHIVNLPLIAVGSVQTKYLTVNKMARVLPFRFGLGALLNLLLTLGLLPLIGLIGAVISTIVSQFVVNIAYPYFSNNLKALRFV